MKKRTKFSLLTRSVLCMALGCTVGISVWTAQAQQNTIEAVDFLVQDGAQIKLDCTDGYENNAILFTAKMDLIEYQNLQKDETVKTSFGMLIVPYEYAKEVAVTTESVFGTDRAYTFDESETGRMLIYRFESDTLSVNETDGYAYYTATLEDLDETEKTTQFLAVSYLKSKNANEEYTYDVKEYNLSNARSMAYVAQKAEEKDSVSAEIKRSLKKNYVAGITEDILITYERDYVGNKVAETTVLTYDLDDEITVENVMARLTEMQVVDPETYASGNGTLQVNGQDVEIAKVYANGLTNATVCITYQAIEDTDAYVYANGYFVTDGFGSIILQSDKTAEFNADYAYGNGEKSDGEYRLYKDGTISLKIGTEHFYGDYDFSNETFNLKADGEEWVYNASTELPIIAYERLRGVYVCGTDEFVFYEDGTSVKNLNYDGYYLLTYNDGALEITVSSSDGETYHGALSYGATGYLVTLNGNTYAQSANKRLADVETYEKFAKIYEGKFPVPAGAAATDLTEQTYTGSIDFNKDGTLVYNGFDAYAPSGYGAEASYHYEKPIAVMLSSKMGRYVLYADGALKMYVSEMPLNKTEHTVQDVTLNGVYDLSNNKITLDTSTCSMYESERIYTSVAKSANADLYADFAGTYVDSSRIWHQWTNWEMTFHADGSVTTNRGEIWNGTYTLHPITENYGTFNVVMTYHTQNNINRINTQYYVKYEDRYVLRLSYGNGGMDNNHFIDVVQKGDSFSSMPIFEQLAGRGGTQQNPTQKIYTDGEASLKLINNGEWAVPRSNGKKYSDNQYLEVDPAYNPGGMAVFNDGTADKTINYNIVALNERSGKIFFTMAETALAYSVKNESEEKYVVGDYTILSDSAQISFTYAGVSYTFVSGVTGNTFEGEYIGGANSLIFNADLTAKYDGKNATYAFDVADIYGGTIKLTVDGTEKRGEYVIDGARLKLVLDGETYVKEILSQSALYEKYAGTYTATYEGGRTMTLTLSADGKVTGVGAGGTLGQIGALPDWAQAYLPEEQPDKHMGSTSRIGTYSFALVDGALQITLCFDVENGEQKYTYGNTEYSMAINSYSGYYAEMRSAITSLQNSTPTEWKNYAVWNVYNFAIGTANADGTLNILFEAFDDQPIQLIKSEQ